MSIRLAFLGDTLIGGAAQEVIDERGYEYPLAGIRHLWADADLAVVNHEAPLTDRTAPATKIDTGRKRYWYKGEPAAAGALRAAGVRLASLANNHVGDFGPEAVIDTMAALDAAGIAHCGAGADDLAARRPVVLIAGGIKIGFLSAMQRYQMYVDEDSYARPGLAGPALLEPSGFAADIAELRQQVDLVVALVHWGRNYKPRTRLQQSLARQITAAGADLVIGHHPHVPHPVTIVNEVPVLYSLGNGPFGSPGRFHSGRSPYGMVALVDVEPHRVVGLELRLIQVDNQEVDFQPVPATDPAAELLLSRLVSRRASGLLASRTAAS